MSPLVYSIGTLQIRAFAFWIALGVLFSTLIVLGSAWRRNLRALPYLDLTVAMVALGVIGARLGHVGLNWAYFSAHPDEIWSLSTGGLDWHGAVISALLGLLLTVALRDLPLIPLLDALAFAVPIMAAAVWIACGVANAAYGLEVRSLADFPAWMVTEAPDVYGMVAPRLALPLFGVFAALFILLVVLLLTILRRFSGSRVWIALGLYALYMMLIGFFRADFVPMLLNRRADQILDLGILWFATTLIALTRLSQLRSPIRLPQGAVS